MLKTSIIDQPIGAADKDLFQITPYKDALCEFIRGADTPITIALQGEWGSGKTSLMHQIQETLASETGEAQFYSVWINTWQHMLLSDVESSVSGILKNIVAQIAQHAKSDNSKNVAGFTRFLVKTAVRTLTNTAGSCIGLKDAGDDALKSFHEQYEKGSISGESDISELKKSIGNLIDAVFLDSGEEKKFLFFIDDLDRIDPPVAVNVLEILKNVFDLKNCIFILAIDYDVVVKGLKPKFGELTSKNEREFRSFFDKIIQVPFSMPVKAYKIDDFLGQVLRSIGFLNSSDNASETLREIEEITRIVQISIGTNPRALKRLTNTLSLIQIIARRTHTNADDQQLEKQKLLNFALVCLQICYPPVYNVLLTYPNFTAWDEALAHKLQLEPLPEGVAERLKITKEFDDAWEQMLYRLCSSDYYLSSRVFDISALLNRIRDMVPPEDDIGVAIESVIKLSAVTNVAAKPSNQPQQVEFHRPTYLKSHMCKFVPAANEVLGGWGKIETNQSRIQSKIEYMTTRSSDDKKYKNDEGFFFTIFHDGKQFKCRLHKWTGLFKGRQTNKLSVLEEAIGQVGARRRILEKLLELKTKYPGVEINEPSWDGCDSWIMFEFGYETLDEACSPDAVKVFAQCAADFIKIHYEFEVLEYAAK